MPKSSEKIRSYKKKCFINKKVKFFFFMLISRLHYGLKSTIGFHSELLNFNQKIQSNSIKKFEMS